MLWIFWIFFQPLQMTPWMTWMQPVHSRSTMMLIMAEAHLDITILIGRGGYESPDNPYYCDFRGLPWHVWRQCRLLIKEQRLPNTTAQQHAALDRRREEILARLSFNDKQRFVQHMNDTSNNGHDRQNIPAQQAQLAQQEAALTFPGEQNVDEKMAVLCTECNETQPVPVRRLRVWIICSPPVI